MGRVAVAVTVILWALPISIMVNHIVPDPYMDEIFHIPQAQQYCRGNFRSWDPMITTPPGLYFLSLAHVASMLPGMWCVRAGSSISDLCSTAILRSINGALAVICSTLVYEIIIHLRPALDERRATIYAIVLSLYPVHWFFTFLYYTDVASVTAVLAMYLACLKRYYWLSALLGVLAITIRQTNVVWMVFVACIGAIDYTGTLNGKNEVLFVEDKSSTGEDDELGGKNSRSVGPNLRKRKMGKLSTTKPDFYGSSAPGFNRASIFGLLDEFQAVILRLWCLKLEVLVTFTPFFMVLMAFIIFVLWNGSLVLGAKEAHAVSPHFAQIMYFGLAFAVAMAPLHFSVDQAATLYLSFRKNKLSSLVQWVSALTTGFISVHFFSIAHPYLLADNRHYPFYIWRKIINAHWSTKYLLVPLYAYSWLSIFNILGRSQKKIWILLFSLACAAVLIPTPLIEFRYYTLPFYFLALHSHTDDRGSWYFIAIQYIIVNIFTVLMFLFQPFQWDHEPGIQRFIW